MLRRLPPGHVREETYDYARGEFDRNIAQRDPVRLVFWRGEDLGDVVADDGG